MIKRYRTSLPHWDRAQPAPPSPGGLADRLFEAFETRLAETPLGQARVLLVGFPAQDRAELRKLARLAGARLTAACVTTTALEDAQGIDRFTHLFIDLDAFPDLEAAIDVLRACRERHPEQIVLLFGRDLRGDDLGAERAPICDASLRLPVDLSRLLRALFAAQVNSRARSAEHLRAQPAVPARRGLQMHERGDKSGAGQDRMVAASEPERPEGRST